MQPRGRPGREPFDQAAIGAFRERIERHLGAGQADGVARIAGAGRGLLERLAEAMRVLVSRLERPVIVEAVEDRCAARLERTHRVAVVERLLERARVHSEVRSAECDRVSGRDDVAGRRPKRLPQLGERHPQARACRFVEHVRPEARGQPPPWLWGTVERKVGEDGTRPPARGQWQAQSSIASRTAGS